MAQILLNSSKKGYGIFRYFLQHIWMDSHHHRHSHSRGSRRDHLTDIGHRLHATVHARLRTALCRMVLVLLWHAEVAQKRNLAATVVRKRVPRPKTPVTRQTKTKQA